MMKLLIQTEEEKEKELEKKRFEMEYSIIKERLAQDERRQLREREKRIALIERGLII